MSTLTKSLFLTVSAGKRLIGRAIAEMSEVYEAMMNRTVVVIAGTTNSYIAEELLRKIGQEEGFERAAFMRGITLPPLYQVGENGRVCGKAFMGDVVIREGKWLKGLTIIDVIDELKKGDIIMKGANAANFEKNQAGILIGDQKGGTILASMQAVIGRRVELYLPVGLEKRVLDDLHAVAAVVNNPDALGHRLYVTSGHIINELEAIAVLTGLQATLMGAGGVCGAEGGIWLTIFGEEEKVKAADAVLSEIVKEPPFEL